MTASQVPLRPEQIEAAQTIYEMRTVDWLRADYALAALAASMPDFSPPAVLLKVVTVNSLHFANVYAIHRAAQHIEDVLAHADLASAGPKLVEEIAAIPGLPARHPSFASKFAHFFIDHRRFPIYDSYAIKMLRDRLGHDALAPEPTCMAFEKAFRTLARMVNLGSDTRQLDRYLWIVGQYRTWANNPASTIDSELRAVFKRDPTELAVAAGIWYRA